MWRRCTTARATAQGLSRCSASSNIGTSYRTTIGRLFCAFPTLSRRWRRTIISCASSTVRNIPCVLLSGFAIRHKIVAGGQRQIIAIHMKGEMVDLQNSLLGRADHSVQMLTAGKVAMIPRDEIKRLAFERPSVGLAMWTDTIHPPGMDRKRWAPRCADAGVAPALRVRVATEGRRLENRRTTNFR